MILILSPPLREEGHEVAEGVHVFENCKGRCLEIIPRERMLVPGKNILHRPTKDVKSEYIQ
jgi:hypothetical protein